MVSGFMRWLDRKERIVVIHVVLSILSKSYPAKDCENACFSVAWMCNSLRRRFHRVRATPTVRRRRLRPRHFSQSGRCLLHHRSESPRRSLLSLAWSGSIHVPPSRTRSLAKPRTLGYRLPAQDTRLCSFGSLSRWIGSHSESRVPTGLDSPEYRNCYAG